MRNEQSSEIMNEPFKPSVRACLQILSRADRIKIVFVVIIQMFTGFLDLLAVAAIGVLGALAVNGIQSKNPGTRVEKVLNLLGVGDFSFQKQVAIIGLSAMFLMICRTFFSIFFTRKTLFFLSHQSARISSDLFAKLLSKPMLFHQKRSNQDTLYSVTNGISTILLGVVGSIVSIVSDLSSLLILLAGLFVLSPNVALGTILLFSLIGLGLFKLLHEKVRKFGEANTSLSVLSNEKILEVLTSYRESVVRNRRYYYSENVRNKRYELAKIQAELQFLPHISKYIIETAMVVGGLCLCAAQFALSDASHAVATLAVFLAAGTRIAPAIMRIQQGAITIKGSLGASTNTLKLIQELNHTLPIAQSVETKPNHFGFMPSVVLSNVSLTYPNGSKPAIRIGSLEITPGSFVAIVGPSGAGKTTLVDLILGILVPNTGRILISGKSPIECIQTWPGAIGYVPQDVSIIRGTILDNVTLGYPVSGIEKPRVLDALKVAQLEEFVGTLPKGLDTEVGERGSQISGGQRQRLGIARAMYSQPLLLVLDEATSALDGQIEAEISGAIQNLKGRTTVIAIAHRLSTVINADQLIYISDGEIIAQGTFEEVRKLVPDFDKQAKLMGAN